MGEPDYYVISTTDKDRCVFCNEQPENVFVKSGKRSDVIVCATCIKILYEDVT